MACDVSSLMVSAAANGYQGLDSRSLMLCLIASMLPGAGTPSANTTMSNGKAYQGYQDWQLDEALSAHLCDLIS